MTFGDVYERELLENKKALSRIPGRRLSSKAFST
jgi:hypothetical protein